MTTLPAWARRLLRKELRLVAEGMEFDREAAGKLLALLAPRRKNEKQKKTAKDKAEGSLRSHLNTAELRGLVMTRADGRCEACGFGLAQNGGAEMDHWLGGTGRRRRMQSAETVWVLCGRCHFRRSHNLPDAKHWNIAFGRHCGFYGYDFTPHVEHAQLPGRAAR